MTKEELTKLSPGDTVRSRSGVYMVTANYGDRVTAVRTVDITNPPEWELIKKVV